MHMGDLDAAEEMMERRTRKGEEETYKRYVAGFLAPDDSILKEAPDAIEDQDFRTEMKDGPKSSSILR